MPKKPLFGSKRPKTKLANGKITRRVHHGALGVRRSQKPRARHLDTDPHLRRCSPRGSAAAAHPVHGDCVSLARVGSGWWMGAEECPRDSSHACAHARSATLTLCLRYCRQEKAAKERARKAWKEKKARLEKNKKDKNDKLLAQHAASFGLSDRPANAEDEAAVLSRLLRETAPLDPNNPALTDFKGAVAASLKELANEEYLGTCSVCYMKKELLTLNCNNSKGLHRMCGACVTDLIDYTRTHPTVGVWARVEERHGYLRDVICPKCPMCQKPFASAWDPSRKPNMIQCLP